MKSCFGVRRSKKAITKKRKPQLPQLIRSWFHTGDAGYFKNGQLFLTERIKDLFKTSNGKYVAPQALETKLVIDRYIDQIAIIADQRKFVSALIVPVYGFVKEYAKKGN
jgi:long-chain acyl-CoA synthetase